MREESDIKSIKIGLLTRSTVSITRTSLRCIYRRWRRQMTTTAKTPATLWAHTYVSYYGPIDLRVKVCCEGADLPLYGTEQTVAGCDKLITNDQPYGTFHYLYITYILLFFWASNRTLKLGPSLWYIPSSLRDDLKWVLVGTSNETYPLRALSTLGTGISVAVWSAAAVELPLKIRMESCSLCGV